MVLATIFKRQQRTVLWSSAILIFTGTLILIGVGVIKLIKNNQPDFVALTGIIVALGGSGVLAYGAEKLHAKMRERIGRYFRMHLFSKKNRMVSC